MEHPQVTGQRTQGGEGTETIVADMTVSFKLVRETFRSRVTLERPKLHILVEYLQGPFSRMPRPVAPLPASAG